LAQLPNLPLVIIRFCQRMIFLVVFGAFNSIGFGRSLVALLCMSTILAASASVCSQGALCEIGSAATLLRAGRYAEAERQFQRALSRAPSNGWSYYRLADYKSRGDTIAARKAEADLARTWIGDRRLSQISNL
jgi:Flp pilus assembly protein TadD